MPGVAQGGTARVVFTVQPEHIARAGQDITVQSPEWGAVRVRLPPIVMPGQQLAATVGGTEPAQPVAAAAGGVAAAAAAPPAAEAIDTFVSVTGASREIAAQCLERAGGNINLAVVNYMNN